MAASAITTSFLTQSGAKAIKPKIIYSRACEIALQVIRILSDQEEVSPRKKVYTYHPKVESFIAHYEFAKSFRLGRLLSPASFRYSDQSIEVSDFREVKTLADLKVLHLVSRMGLRCHFEPKIKAIVPHKRAHAAINELWKGLKTILKSRMGSIELIDDEASEVWLNSATTIDELYSDETKGASLLVPIVRSAAIKCGGTADFGEGDINSIKSRASILSKISRMTDNGTMTLEEAVQQVEDGVRGTVFFPTPETLGRGVGTFVSSMQERGWILSAKNLWDVEYDCAGYLDLEFKIKITLPSGDAAHERFILGEIQFHLDEFYDGTKDSAVARAHKIYEILRMTPEDSLAECILSATELREASRLYFTAALFETLKKHKI